MTFYWYDYETWGLDARYTRPSQFAGIRTDENLEIIGEPLVEYCVPNDDLLPDPYAVFVTGISPQKAKTEGLPEHQFAARIHSELSQPNTISLGYNSINFDEEFNRYLFWRNFYDPYEHTYANGASRWDLVNVVRLMRALRPEGLNWPVVDGRPSNRLEHLTKANGIEHANAHDALADVIATIELAKKIKAAQPKLFDFVFTHRSKASAAKLLDYENVVPVVHSSDKFRSETLGTALVAPFCLHPNGRDVVTWNLKEDPKYLLETDPKELRELLFMNRRLLKESGKTRPAIKAVRLNRCPVLAPLATLDDESAERIKVNLKKALEYRDWIQQNQVKLTDLIKTLLADDETMKPATDPDAALYNAFVSNADRDIVAKVPHTKPEGLEALRGEFNDQRLSKLFFRYRARNFPETLNDEELAEWEMYRSTKLLSENAPHMTFKKYGTLLQKLMNEETNESKKSLLDDLQLWGEALFPADV